MGIHSPSPHCAGRKLGVALLAEGFGLGFQAGHAPFEPPEANDGNLKRNLEYDFRWGGGGVEGESKEQTLCDLPTAFSGDVGQSSGGCTLQERPGEKRGLKSV